MTSPPVPSLPTPGSDAEVWGTELNEFLSVSLNDDGTIKAGALPPDTDIFVTSVNGRASAVVLTAADVAGGTLGQTGQFLSTDGAGNGSWATVPDPDNINVGVTNVNGRTGNVVLTAADVAHGALGYAGQVLQTDGQGHGSWYTIPSGGTGGGGTGSSNYDPNPNAVFLKPLGSGADDTGQIVSAINTAVLTAQTNQTYFAEVWLQPGVYQILSAPVQGGTTYGNAQIPLPVIDPTTPKVILSIRCLSDASSFPHWNQLAGQKSGAVLYSTNVGTYSSTYGAPSILGGPTPEQGYGTMANAPNFEPIYSNMNIIMDGVIAMSQTVNPTMCGFDFTGLAQMALGNIGCFCDASTVSSVGSTLPSNNWTFGLACPSMGNNDVNYCHSYSVEGWYKGVILTEHTNFFRIGVVYNYIGMSVFQMGAGHVSAHVFYVTSESNCIDLDCSQNTNPNAAIVIDVLDNEPNPGSAFTFVTNINDPNDQMHGYIGWASSGPSFTRTPFVNGGVNITIVAIQQSWHEILAPSDVSGTLTLPASGTAFQNPFWRDAFVYVTGGTVSHIDVTSGGRTRTTGVTNGMVCCPTGGSIAVYYTGTPQWVWQMI